MPASPLNGINVLFDLDGTLTDPFVGITRSIDHALTKLGRLSPAPDELRWCIGPPLKTSFAVLLDTTDPALLDAAVEHYRERYSAVGKFENVLIDGIPEILAELGAGGVSMWVATSKLEISAVEIVEHFGLSAHFRAVHGAKSDGRHAAKDDLVGHILTTEAISPDRTVMVGDRSHDVLAAAAHGVAAVGVAWGYGAAGELEEAGAASVAALPTQIPALIAGALRSGQPR